MATVRKMKREELDTVLLSWAKDLGWEPGAFDAPAFWAADPEGFFVAEVEEEEGGRRLVGSVSGVAYGEEYGFVGIYIVDEAFRGRGIGLQLFRHAMTRLEGRNVGLDAVVEQEPNYKKSRFVSYERNKRFQLLLDRDGCDEQPLSTDGSLVAITRENVERIFGCDRWVFPEKREEFLREWVSLPEAATLGYVSPHAPEELSGYVTVRKSDNGWKIGPLTACDSDVANALFDGAVSHVRQRERDSSESSAPVQIFLDIPDVNCEAVEMATARGMEATFECIRMYTKGRPPLDPARVYGITTFELG